MSGVTVTVAPVRASSTSNGVVRTGAPVSSATNRSVRRRVRRPARAGGLHGREQRAGPAGVDPDAGARLAEERGQVEQSVLVLGYDLDAVAVAGELVEEGHRGAAAAAVEQAPVGAEQVGLARSSAAAG